MISWLEPDAPFPAVETALRTPNGLLAASAGVSTAQLLRAYPRGIFPWYSRGEPALWWSPDPRMVLFTDELRISRSLRKRIGAALNTDLKVICDRDFAATIRACAEPRADQDGTWITAEVIDAYTGLHRMGCAHSIEVCSGAKCIGGLYGVSLGRMFFGESMFSRQTDASKIALAALVALLRQEEFALIDCQQKTAHLASLGAREIPRGEFLEFVRRGVEQPTPDWSKYRGQPINALLMETHV